MTLSFMIYIIMIEGDLALVDYIGIRCILSSGGVAGYIIVDQLTVLIDVFVSFNFVGALIMTLSFMIYIIVTDISLFELRSEGVRIFCNFAFLLCCSHLALFHRRCAVGVAGSLDNDVLFIFSTHHIWRSRCFVLSHSLDYHL